MPPSARLLRRLALALLVSASLASANAATTWHVASTGDDARGDGSATAPWATLTKAVASVPAEGGDTIAVAPGTYTGRVVISRSFAQPLTIRSAPPYGATLTDIVDGAGNEVLSIFTVGAANLVIDGFVITNRVPGFAPSTRDNVLIHIQDACRVTLQNNIIHDNAAPGCGNELLKINRGTDTAFPRDIVVRGNVFYDRPSVHGVDMIDSVRPGELDIRENIFFERGTSPNSQSFITLKRQVNDIPAGAAPVRSPRHRIQANVFLSWDGRGDQAFIQLGEDEDAEYMITDALIENNLMLGGSRSRFSAPIQLKGVAAITVRANTVVGHLPASDVAARIGCEGRNPRVHDIAFRGNIWSDPSGAMAGQLISTYGDVDTGTIRLDRNLFWNGGHDLPGAGSVTSTADAHRLVADPLIAGDQSAIALPVWDDAAGRFPSGCTTIRDEFVRLVTTYGAIDAASPARDAADPADMPATDILGRPRDARPDIGCFEVVPAARP